MIRILLADDHALVREGIRAILDKQPDIEVIGEAATGIELCTEARKLSPDLMIVDVSMPELSGIDAIRRIRKQGELPRAIVLSMHSTAEHVLDALRAGAQGYVLKQSVSTELVEAIRIVEAGHRYLSPKASDIVINHQVSGAGEKAAGPLLLEALSDREREVLHLVVAGKTSVRIAETLRISPSTVDTYRSRIMQKLGVNSLAELVRIAVRSGFAPPEE